ncbi:MAG TPA: ABC transporter permease, partial [Candidatus Brocadiia bacterium]|nr:ABC transporter permease [Candidatus Brocadiia bacterium]
MKIVRTLRTAGRALSRNPMRAMLTTLGIVIGIAAVIAMMEIGAGSSAAVQKGIASMGANVLLVMPGSATTSGVSSGSGAAITLTAKDSDAILRQCPSVAAAAPVVSSRTQIVAGGRNWSPRSIYGSTAAFLDIRGWSVAEGAIFTEADVAAARCVCLVGQTIVRELFQGQSPLGASVRLRNVNFKVVGTLAAKGANMMGMDQDDVVIAPWSAIKYKVAGGTLSLGSQSTTSSRSSTTARSDLYHDPPSLYPSAASNYAANNPMLVRFANVDQILVSARSAGQIQSAIKEITAVLRERHRIPEGKDNDFDIRDMTEMTNVLSSTTNLMSNLLLCVGAISLVVGGVGIMNIMLVSVTERTREIGLRMAVGARGRDILTQFLVEAVTLSLIGGAIGILLGTGGAMAVAELAGWRTELSTASIVLAAGFAGAVGVFF